MPGRVDPDGMQRRYWPDYRANQAWCQTPRGGFDTCPVGHGRLNCELFAGRSLSRKRARRPQLAFRSHRTIGLGGASIPSWQGLCTASRRGQVARIIDAAPWQGHRRRRRIQQDILGCEMAPNHRSGTPPPLCLSPFRIGRTSASPPRGVCSRCSQAWRRATSQRASGT